jgi:hypothetical protein
MFGDFCGRSYWVSSEKTAPGCQGAFSTRNIAGYEMLTCKDRSAHPQFLSIFPSPRVKPSMKQFAGVRVQV